MASPQRHFPVLGCRAAAVLLLAAFAGPAANAEEQRSAFADDRGATGAGTPAAEVGNDVICGPRCVGFVLEYHGRPEPLDRLVREIQSADFEKGATLEQLDRALRARGLFTAPVRLKPGAVLDSEYPAIVHLVPEGEASSPGHFVVWLPGSTRGECLVWSGLPGLQSGSWDQLRSRMSGAVLLTSPTAITATAGFVRRSSWIERRLEGPLVAQFLIVFPLCVLFLGARHRPGRWLEPLRRPFAR